MKKETIEKISALIQRADIKVSEMPMVNEVLQELWDYYKTLGAPKASETPKK